MRAGFAMVGVIGLLNICVHATTVVPADLGTLARDARTIVRGQVIALDAVWTDDHHGIETVVTLQAETYLKGQLGTSVQFRVPGGRLGRFQSIMIGAPSFAVGQRVVVFLGGHAPAVPFVLGLNQGVYRLSAAGTGWVVTPPAVLATASAAGTRVVRGDPARRPLPWSDFEGQVRALAKDVQ